MKRLWYSHNALLISSQPQGGSLRGVLRTVCTVAADGGGGMCRCGDHLSIPQGAETRNPHITGGRKERGWKRGEGGGGIERAGGRGEGGRGKRWVRREGWRGRKRRGLNFNDNWIGMVISQNEQKDGR